MSATCVSNGVIAPTSTDDEIDSDDNDNDNDNVYNAVKRLSSGSSYTSISSLPTSSSMIIPAISMRVQLILFLCLVSNGITLTLLFPFVAFMVADFEHVKHSDLGYYVGMVASALFVGRAIGSTLWGLACDRFNRSYVIAISLVLMAFSSIGFGFSTNFAMACSMRFLCGLVNGVVGTVKAWIGDAPEKDQGRVMSLVGVAWSSGLLMGPAVGGFLQHPVRRFPFLFSDDGFFRRLFTSYPYSLPLVFSAILCLLTAALVYVFLEDKRRPLLDCQFSKGTNYIRIMKTSEERWEGHEEDGTNDVNNNDTSLSSTRLRDNDNYVILGNTDSGSDSGSETGYANNDDNDDKFSELKNPESSKRNRNSCWSQCASFNILRDRDVFTSVLMYAVFGAVVVAFEEIYSLFCLTNPSLGGLGFQADQIALSLIVVGALLMIPTPFIFTRMERSFGVLKALQISACASIFFSTSLPILGVVVENRKVLWPLLIIWSASLRLSCSLVFTAISIVINNSVPMYQSGIVNGVALTATSIGRSFSPSLAGALFAFSVTFNSTFINITLSFFGCGLVFLWCLWMASRLPASLGAKHVTCIRGSSIDCRDEN